MSSETRGFLQSLLERLGTYEDREASIPELTPAIEHRRMCVGMSTYDDPAGVWFTLQSLRLFHREMRDGLSFIVIDNHPEGPGAMPLSELTNWIPTLRYIPFRGYRSTAVRDLIFREANADIVCCIDSHVLLQPGALTAIDDYYRERPDSLDLLHGPLLSDALDSVIATHLDPVWSAQQFGRWATSPQLADCEGEPFDIGLHGLGVFACRREAWPGFNPRFRGYGGEEGYIQEKVRRQGGRVLCHPKLGWLHRSPGNPHGISLDGFLRNYLIGWGEVGLDTNEVEEQYRTTFGGPGWEEQFESLLAKTRREARNPFSVFDGILCVGAPDEGPEWLDAAARFEELEIAWQVERLPVENPGEDERAGRVLGLARALAEAKRRGYEHVLVLDEHVTFTDDAITLMHRVRGELTDLDWDILFLGPPEPNLRSSTDEPRAVLHTCEPATCSYALAVHRRAFDRLLDDLPTQPDGVAAWLTEWHDCDRYLSRRVAEGAFTALAASPAIASPGPVTPTAEAPVGFAAGAEGGH